jgi:hypothetical protein
METILNSGLFWGAALAAFAGIVGYLANRYVERTHTSTH